MDWWDESLHDSIAWYLQHSGRQKLILVPRGHLKSSIITVGYSIQTLLKNPDTRILITNATWDNARGFLEQIANYLRDSDLKDYFGFFQTPQTSWTKDAISIAQRTNAAKRGPSIATAGLEKSLASQHYDLIIHDDIVNDENVTSKEQMNKVDNFYRASLNLLDPGGETIIVGTRYSVGDVYGRIIEGELKSINGHPLQTPEDRANWRKFVNR